MSICTLYIEAVVALPALLSSETVANKTAGQFLAKAAGLLLLLPRVAASSAAAVYIYMKIIPDNRHDLLPRQGREGGTRVVCQRGAASGCHSGQAKNNEHF